MQGMRVLQSPVNQYLSIAYSTVVGALLTIFVMVGELAAEDCPGRYSPAAAAPQLYISSAQWREMSAQHDRVGDCPILAADFALAWFWGAAGERADAAKAAYYASLAHGPVVGDQLRLLRAALVVAGLSKDISVDEALRRIHRERSRGGSIYADKALAYSNQLRHFMNTVSVDGRPALAMPGGEVVLADRHGWPSRYTGQAEQRPLSQTGPIFYVRSPYQRVRWWPPASAQQGGQIGRLYARYPQSDGWCTATAIAPRWVITAAHCLFAATADEAQARALRFYPASMRGAIGGIAVKRAWALANAHQQLLNGNIAAYAGSDLAALELTRELEGEGGFVSLASSAAAVQPVELLSFPGDRPAGSLWLSQCQALPIAEAGGTMALVELSCRNHAGQSGALIRQPGSGGAAIGVLSANISRDGQQAVSVAGVFSAALLADVGQIVDGGRPELAPWRELRF